MEKAFSRNDFGGSGIGGMGIRADIDVRAAFRGRNARRAFRGGYLQAWKKRHGLVKKSRRR